MHAACDLSSQKKQEQEEEVFVVVCCCSPPRPCFNTKHKLHTPLVHTSNSNRSTPTALISFLLFLTFI